MIRNCFKRMTSWFVLCASAFSLSAATYRLDRTNTRSTDPNDPTRIVQTGGQRTNGYEVGVNGTVTDAWKVAGGYAYQNAAVIHATTAARVGAQVGQVPHHTFSLWNNYQVLPKLGAAIGIVRRSDMFAAIDNTVMLPGYTRADAALYVSLAERTHDRRSGSLVGSNITVRGRAIATRRPAR